MIVRTLTGIVCLPLLVACTDDSDLEEWSEQLGVDLTVPWTYMRLSEDGEIEKSMTIKFTSKKARSCYGGDWRVAKVLYESAYEQFGSGVWDGEEAAYAVEDQKLTLDRVGNAGICDAGRWFVGVPDGLGLSGNFVENVGWNHKPSATFYAAPSAE